MPKEQAGYYAEAVRRGGTLVSVRVPEEQIDEAVEIMKGHHAVDIDERAAEWQASGWTQSLFKIFSISSQTPDGTGQNPGVLLYTGVRGRS